MDCWSNDCSQLIIIYETKNISFNLSKLNLNSIKIKLSTENMVFDYIINQNLLQIQTNFSLPHEKIHINIYSEYNHIEIFNFKLL